MPSSGFQTCADRKSTRLNSSHTLISYAVFCLKKKQLSRWYDPSVPDDRCDLLCLDLPIAERLRAARLPEVPATGLAERAKALADPTRLTLAAALVDGDELC